METFRQDLHVALRGFSKNRGFTLAVILTMALGIGANTAIFSVVHGVLLRPLPYADGDNLMILQQQRPLAGVQAQGFSPLEMEDYRQQAASFSDIVEYHNMWFVLLGRGEPERVQTGVVSWNYFEMFGVKPVAGRTFRADDDKPGADAVLVLSHSYWQSRFGGDARGHRTGVPDERSSAHGHRGPAVDPAIPGRERRLHARLGLPVPIVGRREDEPQRAHGSGVRTTAARRLARTRPGAISRWSRRGSSRQYPANYPASAGFTATALSLRGELTRGFRPTLAILLAARGSCC